MEFYCGLIFHLVFYINLPLFLKNDALIPKIMSLVHTVVAIVGVYMQWSERITMTEYYFFIANTTAYTIVDTLSLIFIQKRDIKMIIHHIVLFMTTVLEYPYIYFQWGIISEITNIFLYFNWYIVYLEKQGYKKSKLIKTLFKCSSVVLLVLFITIRDINFTYQSFHLINEIDSPFRYISLIITGLNYYWTYLLYIKFKQVMNEERIKLD